MCEKLKILDKISLQCRTQVTFACSSSSDRRTSLLCDTGIYVLELQGNPEDWQPIFLFYKTFCTLLNYAISAHIGIDLSTFIEDLPQFQMYETILNLCLSENLKLSTPTQPEPIYAAWSPNKLNHHVGCLLGVLTNTGVIQIFIKSTNCYGQKQYKALSVTDFVINHFKHNWNETEKSLVEEKSSVEEKLTELKHRISQVAASGNFNLNIGVSIFTRKTVCSICMELQP